jgi:uncharacterized protein YwqG
MILIHINQEFNMKFLIVIPILFVLLLIVFIGCNTKVIVSSKKHPERIILDISLDETQTYSERVQVAKQRLRQHVEQFDLARIADALDKLALVSIRMKTTLTSENEIPLGSSKMGGTPDLPQGMSWPECRGDPMAFLLQIRLDDFAPYDFQGYLPKEGLMYFFYEARAQKWGFDPEDRGNWKVLYYTGDPAKVQRAVLPANLPRESKFRSCNLTIYPELTLPPWESEEIDRLSLSKDEKDSYLDLTTALRPDNETVHCLLGHPDQIQGEMQSECQMASNGIYMGNASSMDDPRRKTLEKGAADWRLLLQIDSDEKGLEMMWGDAGRVYFWIRQQDLEKKDFDNVWLILQCY